LISCSAQDNPGTKKKRGKRGEKKKKRIGRSCVGDTSNGGIKKKEREVKRKKKRKGETSFAISVLRLKRGDGGEKKEKKGNESHICLPLFTPEFFPLNLVTQLFREHPEGLEEPGKERGRNF